MKALDRAGEAVGSLSALAAAIGVSQSTPFMWKSRGTVPVEHCLSIERATNGAVTRAELRPDDYWRHWPDLKAPRATRKAKEAA